MKTILNYYDDPKMSDIQEVVKGDFVKANYPAREFDLTEDREYKVLKINDPVTITIKNDKGEVGMYSVEYFYI